MKKEIEKILEPQKKLFKKFIDEINGKTMDYESCKLLEHFFDEYTKQLVNAFLESLKKLKEAKQ